MFPAWSSLSYRVSLELSLDRLNHSGAYSRVEAIGLRLITSSFSLLLLSHLLRRARHGSLLDMDLSSVGQGLYLPGTLATNNSDPPLRDLHTLIASTH